MADFIRRNGATSNVFRVRLESAYGTALTGLTSASAGLIISTIADNEATATAYTQVGSTIEGIATLGTFAAPTATKIRFKEVDATNHPGDYEIQPADARMAVASAKALRITFSGAASLLSKTIEIQLEPVPANLKQIDQNATDGNNATLNLKQLNIVNSAGTALVASSTGSNGHGIAASGNGSGHGVTATGGASSGSGIVAAAGGGNAHGVSLTGAGAGHGAISTGGATGHGVYGVGGATSGSGVVGQAATSGVGVYGIGAGSGAGVRGDGGATGQGGRFKGGASGGAGILADAQSDNHGLALTGAGTGEGLSATGGATGNGAEFVGGATSGAGIRASGTAGNSAGMSLAGQGSADGLSLQGGATGDGLGATGGATGGYGIHAVGGSGGAGAGVLAQGNLSGTGNSSGIVASATGTGNGIEALAGDTGNGIYGEGGGTSGNGLKAAGVSGNSAGLSAVSSGTALGVEATGDPRLRGSITTATGLTTTTFRDSTKSATNDFYNNCAVAFTSGTLSGLAFRVTDYDGGNKEFTVSEMPTAPSNGDTFVIVGRVTA